MIKDRKYEGIYNIPVTKRLGPNYKAIKNDLDNQYSFRFNKNKKNRFSLVKIGERDKENTLSVFWSIYGNTDTYNIYKTFSEALRELSESIIETNRSNILEFENLLSFNTNRFDLTIDMTNNQYLN